MRPNRFASAALAVFALALLIAADAAPPPAPRPAPPVIPLSTKLRCIIRPTLLGLVPPDDPEDYGEVLVRVMSIAGPQLGLHYEIKERVPKEVPLLPATAGAAQTPAPEQKSHLLPPRSRREPAAQAGAVQMKTIDATRIRRGLITAQRSDSVHRIDSPLFWGDGDWLTDGGLLWLSAGAYRELKTDGATAWDPASLVWEASAAHSELKRLIEARRLALGLAAEDAVRLEVASEVRYPCIVNGERADLPALLCRDSLGLAQCWIMADEANPMLLKLTYLPQDQPGAGAPDAGAAGASEGRPAVSPAQAPAADAAPGTAPARPSLVPSRRRQRPADAGAIDAAPGAPAAAGPPQATGVIGEGTGFAVVELNF
jgi:hypothetical protein